MITEPNGGYIAPKSLRDHGIWATARPAYVLAGASGTTGVPRRAGAASVPGSGHRNARRLTVLAAASLEAATPPEQLRPGTQQRVRAGWGEVATVSMITKGFAPGMGVKPFAVTGHVAGVAGEVASGRREVHLTLAMSATVLPTRNVSRIVFGSCSASETAHISLKLANVHDHQGFYVS